MNLHICNKLPRYQRLSFPGKSVFRVNITCVRVDAGIDNDLCISELALYDRGMRIPWHLTPVVVSACNQESDGQSFSLIGDRGRLCPPELARAGKIMGFAFQPGTSRMLLITEHGLYYYLGMHLTVPDPILVS